MILLRKRVAAVIAIPVVLFVILSRLYATPILMYHHIDERSASWKLSVSPESFSRQMEFLKAHRYKVLALSEYTRILKRGDPIPKKCVVITFDDGYQDNFENAYPVLKKMNFPATIFMQFDGIGREGYVSAEDLAILVENGIEIGSHTLHHPNLTQLDAKEMREEIVESKLALEEVLSRPVTLFSYPGGVHNDAAIRQVQEAGYEAACVTGKSARAALDPFALRRVRVSRTCDNLLVFWIKCSGFYHWIEQIRG